MLVAVRTVRRTLPIAKYNQACHANIQYTLLVSVLSSSHMPFVLAPVQHNEPLETENRLEQILWKVAPCTQKPPLRQFNIIGEDDQ